MKRMMIGILLAVGLLSAGVRAEDGNWQEAAGEGGRTVTAGELQVTIPEELYSIADVEADEDGIRFYEKISHADFGGGFVASLKVYESVTEYANIPSFSNKPRVCYNPED